MENNALFKYCKPMLMVMKLFGIYHSKHPSDTIAKGKFKFLINNWNQTASQLYSKCIIVVHLLNTVRYLFSFNSEDTFGFDLLTKVQFCSLSGIAFYNSIALYNASADASKLYLFFKHWEWIKCKFSNMENKKRFKCYSQHFATYFGVIFTVGFLLGNWFLFGYLLFQTDAYNMVLAPFNENMNSSLDTVTRVLFIVVATYMSAALITPLFLLSSICK